MYLRAMKLEEALVLELPTGEIITIKIKEIDRRGSVRIGIEAPQEITIMRSELLDQRASEIRSQERIEKILKGKY